MDVISSDPLGETRENSLCRSVRGIRPESKYIQVWFVMEVVVSDSRRKCCVGNPITLSYSCHWILAYCNILNDHTHCPCPPYDPPPPLPLSNRIKHGVN